MIIILVRLLLIFCINEKRMIKISKKILIKNQKLLENLHNGFVWVSLPVFILDFRSELESFVLFVSRFNE